MRVRVKKDAKNLAVTAFGGKQYIRAEWRDVPAGCEKEALGHPFLEVEPKAKALTKTDTEGELYVALETTPELKEPVTVYEEKAKKPSTAPKKIKGKD